MGYPHWWKVTTTGFEPGTAFRFLMEREIGTEMRKSSFGMAITADIIDGKIVYKPHLPLQIVHRYWYW